MQYRAPAGAGRVETLGLKSQSAFAFSCPVNPGTHFIWNFARIEAGEANEKREGKTKGRREYEGRKRVWILNC